jgi:hypothetical protein
MSTDDDFSHFDELKTVGLERVLGPSYGMVGHAIIPFQVGGALDMFYFPDAVAGTACATMELILPDGSGPLPSRIGTYELVTFTKYRIGDPAAGAPFKIIERRLCSTLTSVARFGGIEVLNPGDTCEVPGEEDEPFRCLVFDNWAPNAIPFRIGDSRHGLLLCIEVFRSEMEYAMQNGSEALLELLKQHGHYPYSDLDRDPVI